MKMELIDRVMQRMMGTLDEKQLQELRMALVISLEGKERWHVGCGAGG